VRQHFAFRRWGCFSQVHERRSTDDSGMRPLPWIVIPLHYSLNVIVRLDPVRVTEIVPCRSRVRSTAHIGRESLVANRLTNDRLGKVPQPNKRGSNRRHAPYRRRLGCRSRTRGTGLGDVRYANAAARSNKLGIRKSDPTYCKITETRGIRVAHLAND